MLLGVSACRTHRPAPTVAPVPSTTSSDIVGVAPNVRAPHNTVAPRTVTPPVATGDDLARTLVAVFGDTVAPASVDAVNRAGDAPVWDLDVRSYETQTRVAHYVQLFSTSGRDRFAARLSRGSRYEPMIRAKLRASGMPEDLTYLALIESGYDPHAYSRAAAVGMWQFMSGTARDVGLRVDWWMDERRDPVRSTEAAIRFLGILQRQFGSLYLAAAAYNGGPGRVARGLTRFAGEMEGSEGEDRFFALAEQDYLRAETKNYVPQLIAAALVAKMPARYGLSIDSTAPLSYDSLRVDAGTSLASVAGASGVSSATMKDLNPAILRGITPPDVAVWVKVPSGSGERTAAALDALSSDERRGFRSVRVDGSTFATTTFADREGLTVKQLRWFNPTLKTTRSGKLMAGQLVRIPERAVFAFARDLPDPSIERYGGDRAGALTRSGYHVVRRGETLGGIAKRYGMSVSRLRSLNGLRGTRVIAGQTLRVVATRVSTTTSSAKKASAKKSIAKKPAVKKRIVKKPTAKTSVAAKRKTAAKP